ncbi:hypothetical protein CKAH01_18618 [Colletotrichum kahawae]|uniref:Clr5 domain-containing protein n=1 Tax=Colletotrichum kahawae TaxID=34407 RepID=A0AAD9Y7C4_COLKA|nr:hypothetical protein CKAH01_18618 [Colletotrichum kahawae]
MDHTGLQHNEGNDRSLPCGAPIPSHGYIPFSCEKQSPNSDTVPALDLPSVPKNASVKPRQLSEKEWEDLKDVLHKYYILESKTLDQVKKAMLEHGFVLTSKQLTKRFKKWEFKKNVKQSETGQYLLTTGSTPGLDEVSVRGVRVTAAKRERWEKRARHATRDDGIRKSSVDDDSSLKIGWDFHDIAPDQSDKESSLAVPPHNSGTPSSPSSATLSLHSNTPSNSSATLSPNHKALSVSEGSHDGEEDVIETSSNSVLASTAEDHEQAVLRRLFSALRIEWSDPVDPQVFAGSITDTDTVIEYPQTISKEQFMDLSRGGGRASFWQVSRAPDSRRSMKRDASSAFKFPILDALFSNPERDLAEVVLHLGRYNEANEMAQEVHDLALTIDTPGGSLTQRSLHVLAQSYGNLRNLEKEEDLLRQLVQIRLTSSGPRHGDTLAAIRSLCDSIVDSKRYSESEELLRVALELGQTDAVSGRTKCLLCRKLATVLFREASFRESEALYRKTVEMSIRILGKDHPDTLRCQFWLSKTLRALGRLDDSHELHTKTVEQQIRTRGEMRGSTIESMAALSNLLLQMKDVKSAKSWMGRALKCSQHTGGIDNARAMKFWADLGEIEANDGPDQRIAELYEKMSQDISSLVGPGNRSIEEMSSNNDGDRRRIA